MNSYKGIHPTENHLLLERVEYDNVRESGIVVPHQGKENTMFQAIVLAVGPGKKEDGKLVPVNGALYGQKVIIPAHAGTSFKMEDKRYTLVRETEIIAWMKKSKHDKTAETAKRERVSAEDLKKSIKSKK